MRRTAVIFSALLVVLAAAVAGPAQLKDPLEGRWEGKLKTPQGERPVTMTFIKKDGNRYIGSITGLEGKDLNFKEVKLDKDKVSAKVLYAIRGGSADATIKLTLKGDTLQGKADVSFGPGGQSVPFNYELKRAVELAQAAAAEPGKPRLGVPQSQVELDDFNKIKAEPDPAAKKKLIDDFAQKYPDSGLRAYAFQEGAYLGRQSNNLDMMSEYGEKSLEAWPENFVLRTELGSAYAQRNLPDKAESQAERAIELVLDAQKPPQLSEDQWAQGRKQVLGTNFSTLGFVHLRRAQAITDAANRKVEAEKAVAPLKKALEHLPTDDFSLYGLGFAYVFINDYSNAESNLAKAVAVNGAVAPNAKVLLEEIYKTKNKSLDGLDKVIAKAKGELGIP